MLNRPVTIIFIIYAAIISSAKGELTIENLNVSFNKVTYIGHAGDDRIFIAQQSGELLIYQNQSLNPVSFLDVSNLTNNGYEQGLLSFAFHPDYQNNGYVFVFYSNLNNHATVARYQVSNSNPNVVDDNTATIIYSVNEGHGHYGGQLGFGHDGYLYISIGDGGTQGDPECDSQNLNNTLGSILRIDVDQNISVPPYYGIPADNPFDGDNGTPAPEVWSYGFRNPWRFSFDRANGDFYFSDVGQSTREEFNVEDFGTAGGGNYGWKAMEGDYCYDSNDPPTNCPLDTPICGSPQLIEPALSYGRAGGNCSITGGYVYRGSGATQLRGAYIYADWCSGNIWASMKVQTAWLTELLSISLHNITTFGEDAGGEVYLSNGESVYKIINNDLIFVNGFEVYNQ